MFISFAGIVLYANGGLRLSAQGQGLSGTVDRLNSDLWYSYLVGMHCRFNLALLKTLFLFLFYIR